MCPSTDFLRLFYSNGRGLSMFFVPEHINKSSGRFPVGVPPCAQGSVRPWLRAVNICADNEKPPVSIALCVRSGVCRRLGPPQLKRRRRCVEQPPPIPACAANSTRTARSVRVECPNGVAGAFAPPPGFAPNPDPCASPVLRLIRPHAPNLSRVCASGSMETVPSAHGFRREAPDLRTFAV